MDKPMTTKINNQLSEKQKEIEATKAFEKALSVFLKREVEVYRVIVELPQGEFNSRRIPKREGEVRIYLNAIGPSDDVI